MKDRKKIGGIIATMHVLADRDERIGQMFSNVFTMMKQRGIDPFYAENEILEYYMLEYIKNL